MDPGVEMGPLANGRRLVAVTEARRGRTGQGEPRSPPAAQAIGACGYFFEPDRARGGSRRCPGDAGRALRATGRRQPGGLARRGHRNAANSVPFGLAAYGFTNRADYADRMVERVESGNLSINTLEASVPETAPSAASSPAVYGREGGVEGLHNYTWSSRNVSHSISII